MIIYTKSWYNEFNENAFVSYVYSVSQERDILSGNLSVISMLMLNNCMCMFRTVHSTFYI